jgi:hypothetical protein
LGCDERQHISRCHLRRLDPEQREEHPQIEPGRQHRVRPPPRCRELEIVIHDRMTEANLDPPVGAHGALELE